MAQKTLSVLTLLASSSTLLCCALPALLVTLGAGATLASAMSALPFLSAVSTHKTVLFIVSGLILLGNGWLQYRQRYAPCPMDPQAARACRQTRRVGLVIYLFSLGLYVIGFSFAFIIPRVMEALS